MSLNKILAGLLVVVFSIFTLAAILTWSVRSNILNADAYADVLDEAGLFEAPYELIREGDIPQAGGLLLEEGPLSAVSGADLEAAVRELAPPIWLRDQLEGAVRDVIAVADASELEALPDLVISLEEVKARALGEPGDRALATVVGALPDCAPGQTPFELEPDTPVCKPTELDVPAFVAQLKPHLVPLVERVPDTYQVSWQPEQQDVLEDLKQTGQALDRLQVVLLAVVCLNLALLALIWILAVRSPGEWLRWTGVPLLLLGGLAVLVALLAPRIVTWAVEQGDLWTRGDLPLSIRQGLESAFVDLAARLFQPALSIGAALAVIGLVLLLVSPLFPGGRRMSPSQ